MPDNEGLVAEWHLWLGRLKSLIPEARLELARLLSTDFKSVASTDSATQVNRKEATLIAASVLHNEKPQKSLKPAQV